MKMERLYSDASYYNGRGGMAVVAPSWARKYAGGLCSRWNIRVVTDPAWKNHVIFLASCRCSDSGDAEKRALGIAFLIACDILRKRRASKVEIISDSLSILDSIISGCGDGDPVLDSMRRLWEDRRIILSKVKAHWGNPGNELADKWAKRVRRQNGVSAMENSGQNKEDNPIMKMPFTNSNGNNNRNYSNNHSRSGRPNPFAGSTEMDIRKLTEQVLNDENNIGYVTPCGQSRH